MKANRPADVARLVSDRRAELGQTQQQVAERAGVTRQLIARLENGTGDPAVSSLLRVLNALDIDIELHHRTRRASSSGLGSGSIRLRFPVPSLDASKIASAATGMNAERT